MFRSFSEVLMDFLNDSLYVDTLEHFNLHPGMG